MESHDVRGEFGMFVLIAWTAFYWWNALLNWNIPTFGPSWTWSIIVTLGYIGGGCAVFGAIAITERLFRRRRRRH